jgi:aspartate/methionine/tyrosine aminotransferase
MSETTGGRRRSSTKSEGRKSEVNIQPIEYLEWIIRSAWEPQHDLGLSEPQLEVTAGELGLGREDIVINGHNALGYDGLKEHLAERYGVSADNLLCSLGASMANFLLCAVLLEPGDEVVVERPAYEPLVKVPKLFGSTVRRVERPFENGYRLDPSDLRRVLSSKTRLILLTNLHNPSGALLTQEALRELGEMAASVGAYLLVDEIYLEFLFHETPPSAFHLGENFLVTSSLTKVYGLGGLRLGWALCPPELVRRAQELYVSMGVHNPMCAEVFGHLLLSREAVWDRWVGVVRRRVEKNRSLVDQFLARRDDLEWVAPAAGVMVFPRIKGGFSGRQLAALLRERYDTFVIPGHYFEDDRHFRLAFGAHPDILQQGLRHLGSALDELRAGS